MRFPRRGRSCLVALIVLVFGVAAGGIAYASIPDASGVIHGCIKTKSGALRVIDTDAGQACGSKETALDWAKVSAYEAFTPGPPTQAIDITATSGANPTVITHLDVTAGSYAVTASVFVSASGGVGIDQCDADLRQGTTNVSAGSARAAVGTAAGDVRYTTLAFEFAGSVTSAGTVRVGCWQVSLGATMPQMQYADVTAVRVGALTATGTLG
jgi:hypothetical protein